MSEINENISFDYAQIGGVKLYYAQAGNGENLVILLHGFPEFWYSWRHQLAALSDKYTVVAPDMRGYNWSDKPVHVSDYAVDNLVDDVTGLIRHFGREKAAVIGHDWGAAVAWALAMKHPEYLWKLGALQVPPFPVWRKNQSLKQFLASWYMFFFQIPALPEFLLRLNDYAFLKKGLRSTPSNRNTFTEEDIKEYERAWSEPFALTAMINYYRANFFPRFFTKAPAPAKIKVPTLFIYGEKDFAILPETVENVGQMIDAPFSEFRIPSAGHWIQQEAKDEVTDALLEFLAE